GEGARYDGHVAVADPTGVHLDQHRAGARRRDRPFDQLQGTTGTRHLYGPPPCHFAPSLTRGRSFFFGEALPIPQTSGFRTRHGASGRYPGMTPRIATVTGGAILFIALLAGCAHSPKVGRSPYESSSQNGRGLGYSELQLNERTIQVTFAADSS